MTELMRGPIVNLMHNAFEEWARLHRTYFGDAAFRNKVAEHAADTVERAMIETVEDATQLTVRMSVYVQREAALAYAAEFGRLLQADIGAAARKASVAAGSIPPMRHSNINPTSIKTVGAGRPHMTKGEYRVGIDFNPSGDANVILIKRAAADLIDLIEGVPNSTIIPEVGRLKALAQTAIEEGAMWAVKATTKKPLDE